MIKFFALATADGLEVLQTPPYAVRLEDGSTGLLRMRDGVLWSDAGTVEPTDPRLIYAKPEEIIAKRAAGSPQVLSWREIDPKDLPQDRTFRNAWKPDLTVDMAKARDIWRDKMRRARAPKLAELDIEYQRADEAADVVRKRDVARRKQALRDVTKDPRIEAASTPEALKAVWPEGLGDAVPR